MTRREQVAHRPTHGVALLAYLDRRARAQLGRSLGALASQLVCAAAKAFRIEHAPAFLRVALLAEAFPAHAPLLVALELPVAEQLLDAGGAH